MRTEHIREEQQVLAEAFEAWKGTYQITNPPPEKRTKVDIEANWWKNNKLVWNSIVWALGLYVASRTGWGIHNANLKEGFNFYLSVGITILAVWGIEGFIANYGFHRPRKLEISGVAKVLQRGLGWISLLVGLVISAAAGLEISMNAAEAVQEVWGDTVEQILSVSLGIGLTFVLFGISEFVGRLKWVNEHKPLIPEFEHEQRMREYREEMKDEWQNSGVYLELMVDKEVKREQARYDIDNATYKRREMLRAKRDVEIEQAKQGAVEPSPEPSMKPSPEPSTKTQNEAEIETQNEAETETYRGHKSDLVKEYMDEFATPENSPTISEIKTWAAQQGVAVSSGTISEARRDWYNNNDPFRD